MNEDNQNPEEKIDLRTLIQRVQNWIMAMLNAWKLIFLGTALIGGLFFAYKMLKKVSYTASTTFVLEASSGSGLSSQLSSLANLTGVNIGALTENSGVFQIDNIIELYRSYRMLKKTLLSEVEISSTKERLITYYARKNDLQEKWMGVGVDFEIPEDQMVVKHDSVLKKVVEKMLEGSLGVSKPSRKLTILNVSYTSDDPLFAKSFDEILVSNVNEFYLETKTKKTGENLRILSYQTDSVKNVLDSSLLELARFEERNPNLNPLRASAQVPIQKLQIDVQASGLVYQEMVKNLEIAKLAHRNSQPLIQIIDEPVLPLRDNRMKWYKALVIGLFLGGVIMVISLTLRYLFRLALKNETMLSS